MFKVSHPCKEEMASETLFPFHPLGKTHMPYFPYQYFSTKKMCFIANPEEKNIFCMYTYTHTHTHTYTHSALLSSKKEQQANRHNGLKVFSHIYSLCSSVLQLIFSPFIFYTLKYHYTQNSEI
jgi:hypothetical protein